jgi:hypothetical protein
LHWVFERMADRLGISIAVRVGGVHRELPQIPLRSKTVPTRPVHISLMTAIGRKRPVRFQAHSLKSGHEVKELHRLLPTKPGRPVDIARKSGSRKNCHPTVSDRVRLRHAPFGHRPALDPTCKPLVVKSRRDRVPPVFVTNRIKAEGAFPPLIAT